MLLRPNPIIWFGLAAMIAFALSILLYNPILRRFTGVPPPRFSIDYFHYSDTISPAMRTGAIVVAGILIAITFSIVPCHLRLTDSALFLGACLKKPLLVSFDPSLIVLQALVLASEAVQSSVASRKAWFFGSERESEQPRVSRGFGHRHELHP